MEIPLKLHILSASASLWECMKQSLALSSNRIGLYPFPDPFTHEENVKLKTLTQK